MKVRSLVVLIILALLLAASTLAQNHPAISNPSAIQARISAAIGGEQSAYHARGLSLQNPVQGLDAEFAPSGADFRQGANHWTLALVSYGRGRQVRSARVTTPEGKANRIEYRRGAITEWYVNGPAGIEQGFNVARRPNGPDGNPLTLALALAGDLNTTVDADGRGLTLSKDGVAALRYRGLSATDARGRELRAWLELAKDRLSVHVDDRDAQYPLTIDPLVETATLKASDATKNDGLGIAVAISKDGNSIFASAPAPFSTTRTPTIFVFQKSGTTWSNLTEVAKLTASDFVQGDFDLFGRFPDQLAASGDGNVVVVGAPRADIGANVNQGAVYVFTKPAGGWSSVHESAKLVAADGVTDDEFGLAVATDDTGSTIAVGETGESAGSFSHGAAYVFVKSGASYVQAAKLTNSDPVTIHDACSTCADFFGARVALSGDGNTAVVGAPAFEPSPGGSAYIFSKPATGWVNATETAKLKAADAAAQFGFSVSTTTDGSRIAVGALQVPFPTGAIYVFQKPAGAWVSGVQPVAKLTASDKPNFLGVTTRLSADGKTIAATAFSLTNSIYAFAEPVTGWKDAVEDAKFPGLDLFAIGLNGDGSVLAIGDQNNPVDQNAPDQFSGRVQVLTGSLLPDFSVTAAPLSVALGGSGSSTVTVTSVNKFDSAVGLSLSGVPAGVVASLDPASVTPAPQGGTATSQLNVTVGPAVIAGTYGFTVNGTVGTLTHSAAVRLTVQATTGGVSTVINEDLAAGCIDNSGIGGALLSKLAQAQAEIDAGLTQDAINTLTSLLNQLLAQSGKHIATTCTVNGVTFNPVAVLISDVQALLAGLKTSGVVNPLFGYVVDVTSKGVGGVTMGIFDSNNSLVGTMITDSTGFYFLAQTSVLTTGTNYTVKPTSIPSPFTTSTPAAQTFQWQGTLTSLPVFTMK